jgi:hypothetical protein
MEPWNHKKDSDGPTLTAVGGLAQWLFLTLLVWVIVSVVVGLTVGPMNPLWTIPMFVFSGWLVNRFS